MNPLRTASSWKNAGTALLSAKAVQNGQFVHTAGKPSGKYDAVIIGGGHNGLVAASYLAKAGKRVCVLERRHLLGGAAVTEEIVPGFKFSRASYLLSLFRPQIIDELELRQHGLKYIIKEFGSFTPMRGSLKSLLLGQNMVENQRQIAAFSQTDAEAFPRYEAMLEHIIKCVAPLMDFEPLNVTEDSRLKILKQCYKVWKTVKPLGLKNSLDLYEIMVSPISKVLSKWFESEPLKATLATDGVIGFMASPYSVGSGYVLVHHLLGELDGRQGSWAFAVGGMGAVSDAIAKSARKHGAELYIDSPVSNILLDSEGHASGVKLADGAEIDATSVLSNATPKVTFMDLIPDPEHNLPRDFLTAVRNIDYNSPVTKINVALKTLPRFIGRPDDPQGVVQPHHKTTIHLNCERMEDIHEAYLDASCGRYSTRPAIEMTLPSSVDPSIAPKDCHVALLFTQYTPYTMSGGLKWDAGMKKQYADSVFDNIEEYSPGFRASIVDYEVLTPPDIENIFGLTGGNIFHGAMTLDQLYWGRPVPRWSNCATPISGLFLCGSGAHPGGGVTGAPGKLAAMHVLDGGAL